MNADRCRVRYLARERALAPGKVGAAIVTLVFVLIFNFFLFRVMGDPTTQLARLPQASPEEIEQLTSRLRPRQAAASASSSTTSATRVTLDLGISQTTREPVWDEILAALPWTLLLVGIGTLRGDPARRLDGGGRGDAARLEDR